MIGAGLLGEFKPGLFRSLKSSFAPDLLGALAFDGIDGFESGPAALDSESSGDSGASRGGGLNVGLIT